MVNRQKGFWVKDASSKYAFDSEKIDDDCQKHIEKAKRQRIEAEKYLYDYLTKDGYLEIDTNMKFLIDVLVDYKTNKLQLTENCFIKKTEAAATDSVNKK